MKLATLHDGTLDGKLIVVSRDLSRAADASSIAPNLRVALETWKESESRLKELSAQLDAGRAPGSFSFDRAAAAAPLPRAPQFLDGSSFLSHGRRMVQAFKLSTASIEVKHPLMYQGVSDAFLGAHAAMPVPNEELGIDIEAEIGVIVGAVPMGVMSAQSADYVRLLVLFDDVSLRRLLFGEMTLGFGMIQSKPTSVFSPVAITPDELGEAWRDGRVHLRMDVSVNGKRLGNLATDQMGFSFYDLIAHAARTRTLGAGTIIGSGTVSNEDTSAGTACIAERRALEILERGEPKTDWLRFNDRVRIDVLDAENRSPFGAIDHTFVPLSVEANS
jgi:fumarylacetoacetate (FAA) hydrolase